MPIQHTLTYGDHFDRCSELSRCELKLIQGTCRLSLKMGKGDEQKPPDALYQTVVNIDFRSSEMPSLPNNGIFKSICWTFADPLNPL